jgi:hypothetical protein
LFDKTFKDNQGHIVVAQWPNAPLYAWIVLKVAAMLTKGSTTKALTIAAAIVLATWALLELFKGVNYFRRGLGLIVFVMSIASVISLIQK